MRKGKESSNVPITEARELLLMLCGPVKDLTHFVPVSESESDVNRPVSYNHLLEEGKRLHVSFVCMCVCMYVCK